MDEVFFRSGWNYDRDAASLETGLACEDESLTIQSQAQEADINELVRRFGVTGQLPQVAMPPSIAEFTEVFDYRSALETMMRAQESFAALPAEIRSRFRNDAAEFVVFVDRELEAGRLEELRKMGLAVAEKPAEVKAAEVKP